MSREGSQAERGRMVKHTAEENPASSESQCQYNVV